MKIVRIKDIAGTDREVRCPRGGFISYRILLDKDKMGYTLTKTFVPAGSPQRWHYKKHLETCFCISGGGVLKNIATGEHHIILPDTAYVLDKHDEHEFEAYIDTILICVFNPPLLGREVHGPDGSY